jgi:endonuclease/exonuclease/phosphatase (EEP) superfamily protein YafD
LKIISWNLLRRTGAEAKHVADVIEQEKPDLFLMQEATQEIRELPELVGGTLLHEPMPSRIYGLAGWTPHEVTSGQTFTLPVSRMPGRLPPRVAQLLHMGEITFANVHLSHGQWLNRWQLMRLSSTLHGPAMIIGDFNALGPTYLPGFADVGPRERTHMCGNLLPVRLDRCLARGIRCLSTQVLDRGASDHHPIVLTFQTDLHVPKAVPVAAE